MSNDETQSFRNRAPDDVGKGQYDENLQPLEDGEFHDDDTYVEGAEELTQDWDQYEDNPDDVADEEAPAKKSYFNIIVIGLAVVVGLFFLLNAMMGHRTTTRLNHDNLANAGQLPGTGLSPVTPPVDSAETGTPNAGLLNDQAALNSLPAKIETANTAANAAPVATAGTVDPVPAPATASAQAQAPASAPAANVQPMAPDSMFMKAGVSSSTTETHVVPVQPAPTATPVVPKPAASAPAAAAADPRIDQVLARLAADEDMMIAMPKKSDAGVNTAALDRLTARLDKIEQTQSQLAAQLQSIAQNSGPAGANNAQSTGAAGMTPMPASSEIPRTSVPRPHVRTARVMPHVRTDTREGSAAIWTLKSAQPGEAYVSAPGSDAMIAVHPGETFPGVGKVVSIDQTGGQWVVHGTQGVIKQ